ncbi:hypothetical protein PLESTB_000781900 [Pleodorina starrii]|uniref:DUF2237 domain-containing protein n=1 Tax=Pleodorina starrii TaxID=330485 RepID=A0A9W6BLG6_9CHLO|nr:hypothetical protein PLESTM_000503000 [Pleodorina starrii]GLC53737.1 hypothetical protein PLESTB_000781900 [Pleodorina starrii]GLC72917.1 hypothetical protein PLESTF_001309500 [Pleodorina starrii]
MALRRFCNAAHRTTCIRPGRRTVVTRAAMSTQSNGNGVGHAAAVDGPRNVLGGPLQCCCTSPRTGYYRDGYCRTDASDVGRHVICAQVTQEFLEFTRSRGNDLMTPAPWYNFPGLKHGDKWCLCAVRWREALEEGKAPPVFLRCTNVKALEYVTLEDLKRHAADLEDAGAAA